MDDYTRQRIAEYKAGGMSREWIAKTLGLTEWTVRTAQEQDAPEAVPVAKAETVKDFDANTGTITTRSADIRTLDQALESADVDLSVWEVDRHVVNSWEVTMSAKSAQSDKAETYTNFQVKVWLKRKTPVVLSLEAVLAEIAENAPVVKRKKYPVLKGTRRMLEVTIVDPHLGLRCYAPGAALDWTLDLCERTVMSVLSSVVERAKAFGPFESVVFPFGNDFMHADNVFHTTTAGTGQPEMESWAHVWKQAELLSVQMVEVLKEIAPVEVYIVPGNHARQSEFAMGRFIRAWYRNDDNVSVHADSEPYKFHSYGVNLIGYEHGHSVKAGTLPALMANETRTTGWADAKYCEWHLGDQHRKGSSKPSTMEEQGVSVEYLPGLTPPNEWHKIKGFNWQKRAGLGFVWDHDAGPVARVQCNLDSATGELMGVSNDGAMVGE